MRRKVWDVSELEEGTNRFPQGYHWNTQSGIDGLAYIEVSFNERFGTRAEEARSPTNPILLIPTAWQEAIRLAVQITDMAQAVGVPLPDNVLVRRVN